MNYGDPYNLLYPPATSTRQVGGGGEGEGKEKGRRRREEEEIRRKKEEKRRNREGKGERSRPSFDVHQQTLELNLPNGCHLSLLRERERGGGRRE